MSCDWSITLLRILKVLTHLSEITVNMLFWEVITSEQKHYKKYGKT